MQFRKRAQLRRQPSNCVCAHGAGCSWLRFVSGGWRTTACIYLCIREVRLPMTAKIRILCVILNGMKEHSGRTTSPSSSSVWIFVSVKLVVEWSMLPPSMQENSWCRTTGQPFKDPILVIITFAAIIGSFSLLCGFVLLCVVSKTLNNEISEALLLVGMGFFITSVSYVTWKITNKRRLEQMILAMKEDIV